MSTEPGGRSLTGYRYLLAVVMLVALTTVPMLVAVVAGAATLSEAPAPPEDAAPFVTYSGPSGHGCPGPVGSP
ncbi:MAG: hypothetical protein GEV12_11295 [Micromonosporaceae bacterium]|nr:hypothetical protein [Micromonosporaceae bacterium]